MDPHAESTLELSIRSLIEASKNRFHRGWVSRRHRHKYPERARYQEV
jgi:hypothetical protein